MKKSFSIFCMVLFYVSSVLLTACSNKREGQPKVLVFSKTEGFRHESIPKRRQALLKMAKEHNFSVDTTENSASFTKENLSQYSAVVFLNTTGNVLDYEQQAAFEQYIQAGGGYVGVHAASDTEYNWPWYGKLVGTYFEEHPKVQPAKLKIHSDANFPVLDTLPNPWTHTDEWYNFKKQPPKDANILTQIDEDAYEGGSMGSNHPMVWYREFDGGRSFYMGVGHTEQSYSNSNVLAILEAGIKYAIGDNEQLNYEAATQRLVPAQNRFSRRLLAGNLDENTAVLH